MQALTPLLLPALPLPAARPAQGPLQQLPGGSQAWSAISCPTRSFKAPIKTLSPLSPAPAALGFCLRTFAPAPAPPGQLPSQIPEGLTASFLPGACSEPPVTEVSLSWFCKTAAPHPVTPSLTLF